MKSKRIALSLLMIIFISWISFKGYDINFFQNLKPVVKHLANFGLLISTALTGYFAIKPFQEKWILSVWVLVYTSVVIVLVSIGIVDVFHRITNYLVRDSIAPIRMFFTSPVPFLIILFLKRTTPQPVAEKWK